MTTPSSDIAFSPAVKREQEERGSRAAYARQEARGGWPTTVTPELAAYLAELDTLFIATSSAAGQPYIQHRGGPKGFLKALDERTLAFADFKGNRQYITLGNLAENDRVCLFLPEFAGRRRIKLWGRARAVEGDAALLNRLSDPAYDGVPERAIVIAVEAWDANCRQHLTARYTGADIAPIVDDLKARIAALEAALADRSAEPA
jgi:hypothetical protein